MDKAYIALAHEVPQQLSQLLRRLDACHQAMLAESFRVLKEGRALILAGPMYLQLHEEPCMAVGRQPSANTVNPTSK